MKRRTWLLAIWFMLVAALVSSAGTTVLSGPAGQDKEELGRIEEAIRASIGWAKNKDLKLLYDTIANDPDFLEVHPEGSLVKGFEEFKKAERIWMSPNFKAVRYEIRDLRIKLSRSGDVAWFFCILDDINEWKGQPANWENTRWTGVLEKRGGRWVMAQQHFSFTREEAPAGPAGPYLGQKPPGMTPEIFAPGIVSTGLDELNSVFSPDGNEFYYCVRNMGASSLFIMKRVGQTWGAPQPLPFAGPYNDIDVSLSPDGRQLFFCSNRPVSGSGPARQDHDIWMCERTGDTWGPPRHLGDAVNSPREDFYPVATNNKTLYFNSQRAGEGTNDIYFCRWVDGKYVPAEKLGPEVNTEHREFDAFVDPDERFLIFSSERPGDDRFGDLYISFKTDGGAWTPAKNMGKGINGPGPEYGTVLTPDKKFLLFTRQTHPRIARPAGRPLTRDDYVKMQAGPNNGSTDIWWVDAHVIEEARTGPVGVGFPVLFYSDRNGNKDVYILHPGEKEPRNLTNHPTQDLCPAASPDGKRVLFLSDRNGNMDIYGMARDGSDVRRLTVSPETEEHPEFTPDGKQILFIRDFEKRTEIWIMNADGSGTRRLTNNEARDERPFLSPDGSKIVFMSNRDGNYEIYTMAPDGSRQARLTNTPQLEIFPVWSPDGTKIAYAQKFRADGRMQGMIRVMNADGTGDRAVTAVETRDENPMWSPDGRAIILQSVRDGNFEVYQVDLDGGRPVRLTDHPAWDGWACYLPVKK